MIYTNQYDLKSIYVSINKGFIDQKLKSKNEIFSNDKLFKELPSSTMSHISSKETSIISYFHVIDKPKLNYQGF